MFDHLNLRAKNKHHVTTPERVASVYTTTAVGRERFRAVLFKPSDHVPDHNQAYCHSASEETQFS